MPEVSSAPEVLPTSRALLRTTLAVAVVASLLVVCVVLPAEYGVDPTGVGRVLGLTQMGKLKLVLMQEEAELEKAATSAATESSSVAGTSSDPLMHRDSMTVTIAPQAGLEVKLAMTKGQIASYGWSVDSGSVLYELHGEGPEAAGRPVQTYGQGVLHSAEGDIVAPFDGNHGWYWKNPTNRDVKVTVKTWGQFQALRNM